MAAPSTVRKASWRLLAFKAAPSNDAQHSYSSQDPPRICRNPIRQVLKAADRNTEENIRNWPSQDERPQEEQEHPLPGYQFCN
jgi:hypothetical protein